MNEKMVKRNKKKKKPTSCVILALFMYVHILGLFRELACSLLLCVVSIEHFT